MENQPEQKQELSEQEIAANQQAQRESDAHIAIFDALAAAKIARPTECEAWQKTILQQWKRGRIVQADYEREWDDAQDEINRGRAKLNDTTSVDQLLAALTDLGAAIRMMEPIKRKTNLARLFQIIEVNDAGQICSVVPQIWALEAFKMLVEAFTCHQMGRVGLEPNSWQVIEWARVGMPT